MSSHERTLYLTWFENSIEKNITIFTMTHFTDIILNPNIHIFSYSYFYFYYCSFKMEINTGKPVLSKKPDQFCPSLFFGSVSHAHYQGWVFLQKSELLVCWEKRTINANVVLTFFSFITLTILWFLWRTPSELSHLPEHINFSPHLD